jgi:hypothetical protein
MNTVGAACSPAIGHDGTPLPHRPLLQDDLQRVLNQNGSVVPLVHQYDRCPELAHHVNTELKDVWLSKLDKRDVRQRFRIL